MGPGPLQEQRPRPPEAPGRLDACGLGLAPHAGPRPVKWGAMTEEPRDPATLSVPMLLHPPPRDSVSPVVTNRDGWVCAMVAECARAA